MTLIEQMVVDKMEEVLAETEVLAEKMTVDAMATSGASTVVALSEQKTLTDANAKSMVRLTMQTMILKGLIT